MQHKETMHGSAACDAIGAKSNLSNASRVLLSERVTIHDITAGGPVGTQSPNCCSQRSDGTEAILPHSTQGT